MFSLQGKTALVTGATGGIGEAIAAALIAQGAKVAISGTRQEKLDALAGKFGTHAVPIAANLNDAAGVAKLADDAAKALEKIDILVCNAGITRDGLAMRMKDEDWDEVVRVNLTGSFQLIRACLRGMMKQRSGRIISVTSIVGATGNPGQANYCAAKAGLTGMTKSLAQEVASRGITVNCLAPGFISTPMTEVLTEDQQARIRTNIPMGEMGTPADIAAGVVYLASDEARYVTGQTLHINGGLFMGF